MNLDVAPALPDPDLHSVRTPDGWELYVYDFSPASDARGVVIAGHAMMCDAQTLCRRDRPTLVWILVRAGYRVLVPDLRGHGESGPSAGEGADWSYDALVEDVGLFVEVARDLAPRLPVVLLGHSMFAHTCLAWLGQNPEAPVSAAVLMAGDFWNRRFEPSRLRWWLKRLATWPGWLLTAALGYFPARALGFGNADESLSFARQMVGSLRRNEWRSADGEIDYYAGVTQISVPVLHVVSEGDRFMASPRSALNFTAALSEREVLVVGRDDAPADLREYRPDHMGIITSPNSAGIWWSVARWLSARTSS